MSKKLPYQRGFLLYHSSHGPCRVKDIVKETQSGKEQYYYSLESKQSRFKGAKFLIDSNQVEVSGFHPAISEKEANKILEYLKTNEPKNRDLQKAQSETILNLTKENNPWAFSRVVMIFSLEKDGKAAKGKREMLDRATRGLMNELSFALDISEEEALSRMKKCLESNTNVNRWVIDVISKSLADV